MRRNKESEEKSIEYRFYRSDVPRCEKNEPSVSRRSFATQKRTGKSLVSVSNRVVRLCFKRAECKNVGGGSRYGSGQGRSQATCSALTVHRTVIHYRNAASLPRRPDKCRAQNAELLRKAPSGRELPTQSGEGECVRFDFHLIINSRRLLPSRQAAPPPSRREAW